MTDPLDTDAIDPLLKLARSGPPPEVALSALSAAASFNLTPQAWHDVATVLNQQIESLPAGSGTRQQALRLGTRIPLRSWREHLRQLADDATEPDAEALNQALVQVRDPTRIDWVLAQAAQHPDWAVQVLATLPIEQTLQLADLPPLPEDADPMAAFWLAIARARLGDTQMLDQLLTDAVDDLPLFWGSPWTAYDAVARVRPLPAALHEHLLQLLERLTTDPPPDENHAVRRMRELTVWAATGICDAQGNPRSEQASQPVLGRPRSRAASASARARARQLRNQEAFAWFDVSADPDTREALSAMPKGSSPRLVQVLLQEANQRAAALPREAPASILLGNHVTELVGALPIDGPEPAAKYVQLHLSAPRPALDDGQMAWLLARDAPAHLIGTLERLSRKQPSPDAQCQVLSLLESAADCQAGRIAGPSRGAGPGGDAAGMIELIDDMQEQMVSAAAPADEVAAAGAGDASASPRQPAPAPPAPAMRARASITPPDTATSAAPEPEQRRVNAVILHQRERRSTFVAGADNIVRCWIGLPEQGVASSDQVVPQVAIPATGLALQAYLCWRDSSGKTHEDSQPVLLPPSRTASSNQCDLRLHIPTGERYVSADIAFLYRGRVFEAVRFEAFVLEAGQKESERDQIRILVQAAHRHVLEIQDSAPVDSVVLVPRAQTPDGHADPSLPRLRRFGSRGSQHFDLQRAKHAIGWLNDTLHATQTLIVRKQAKKTRPADGAAVAVVDVFDDTDPDARGLLLDMARHGTLLYKELRDQGFGDPGQRFQILCEDNDDHAPLEFTYDRGYPSAQAAWCKPGLAALREEAPTCPVCQFPGQENELGHVEVLCPYGFWSLRKVIERMSPVSDGAESDPGMARRLLSPMTSVAFASSHLVPEPERQATLKALQQHFDTVLPADDWLQWRKVVKQNPALLMVLPHHGIQSQLDYLEIGDQALDEALGKLSAAQIDEMVVNPDCHDPGPVVLLLGCQTARISETGYGDLANRIHRQHASIVLGTLAQILGRHAGPIAREFALTLADLSGQESDFGSVMLQVRQRMLARGCLIAMCLVAQGDAQWRLQPRPPASPGAATTTT